MTEWITTDDALLNAHVGQIVHLARRFADKYHTDENDTTQEAFALYYRAAEFYDDTRSRFSTWLHWQVWGGLLTWGTRERRAARRLIPYSSIDRLPSPQRRDLRQALDEVSDDARHVATLALDPPPDVRLIAANRVNGAGTATALRVAIKEFLTEAGWAATRIVAAFAEVKDALRGGRSCN